ncbi:response regulator FixJ [Microvirga massiliensis]|uniref:response regulator FixJ n=1 Tax=Microvirga massiliensis TaxID=1033741 RepID=UPI00062BBFD0|nr:response regulator FixJ [Microvirga massiliensis]
MDTEPIVHVIDDDVAVRKALSFLLVSAEFHVRVHASAVDFLDFVADIEVGCIVTDVRMPGMDGIEFMGRLRERGFRTPVVVMTGHADVPLAVEAMKAGAVDFLEKPFSDDRFLEVVQSAIRASQDRPTESEEVRAAKALIESLSERESQVLQGLVDGKANKVIAHDLELSPRTVEIYRANVMNKLKAKSLSEVIRMALLVQNRG